MQKQCPKCQQIKDLTEFALDKTKKLGRHSYCRPCANEKTKQWRAKILAINPQYYRDLYRTNPQKAKECVKRYRDRNKERLNRQKRERYKLNPEIEHQSYLRWYSKHKEERRINRYLYGYTWYGRKQPRPMSGFLKTQGICLFCGELNPLLLQNAHIFPKDHDLLISLCANCHYLLDHYPTALETNAIYVLSET